MRFLSVNYPDSHAQMFQDLMVLFMTNEQQGGFFVEFGASDGILLSNTALLEKTYGWSGILAEPARCWHDDLQRNRTALIDHACVVGAGDRQITFSEVVDNPLFSSSDVSRGQRTRSKGHQTVEYAVPTMTLQDLLEKHSAPETIDYLSIDTEGSEWDILRSFNFDRRSIRLITVEHNGEPNRSLIWGLMREKGFVPIFPGLPQWDDWYANADAWPAHWRPLPSSP